MFVHLENSTGEFFAALLEGPRARAIEGNANRIFLHYFDSSWIESEIERRIAYGYFQSTSDRAHMWKQFLRFTSEDYPKHLTERKRDHLAVALGIRCAPAWGQEVLDAVITLEYLKGVWNLRTRVSLKNRFTLPDAQYWEREEEDVSIFQAWSLIRSAVLDPDDFLEKLPFEWRGSFDNDRMVTITGFVCQPDRSIDRNVVSAFVNDVWLSPWEYGEAMLDDYRNQQFFNGDRHHLASEVDFATAALKYAKEVPLGIGYWGQVQQMCGYLRENRHDEALGLLLGRIELDSLASEKVRALNRSNTMVWLQPRFGRNVASSFKQRQFLNAFKLPEQMTDLFILGLAKGLSVGDPGCPDDLEMCESHRLTAFTLERLSSDDSGYLLTELRSHWLEKGQFNTHLGPLVTKFLATQPGLESEQLLVALGFGLREEVRPGQMWYEHCYLPALEFLFSRQASTPGYLAESVRRMADKFGFAHFERVSQRVAGNFPFVYDFVRESPAAVNRELTQKLVAVMHDEFRRLGVWSRQPELAWSKFDEFEDQDFFVLDDVSVSAKSAEVHADPSPQEPIYDSSLSVTSIADALWQLEEGLSNNQRADFEVLFRSLCQREGVSWELDARILADNRFSSSLQQWIVRRRLGEARRAGLEDVEDLQYVVPLRNVRNGYVREFAWEYLSTLASRGISIPELEFSSTRGEGNCGSSTD